ncbi:MAG: hypothetical protein JSR71_07450 [Proteobacteria bacterium]|nr:hypothetical protein [Pseudomonadota bacterium]
MLIRGKVAIQKSRQNDNAHCIKTKSAKTLLHGSNSCQCKHFSESQDLEHGGQCRLAVNASFRKRMTTMAPFVSNGNGKKWLGFMVEFLNNKGMLLA